MNIVYPLLILTGFARINFVMVKESILVWLTDGSNNISFFQNLTSMFLVPAMNNVSQLQAYAGYWFLPFPSEIGFCLFDPPIPHKSDFCSMLQ